MEHLKPPFWNFKESIGELLTLSQLFTSWLKFWIAKMFYGL